MSMAIAYDRAVGFFNSAIFSIAWPAMKGFVERRGKIRIVCSPILSKDDVTAIEEGYSGKNFDEFSKKISKEIAELLKHPVLSKPTKALAALVSMDLLELKVAFISKNSDVTYSQIFHDKV